MRYADAEQWVGAALLGVWVVAALAGRWGRAAIAGTGVAAVLFAMQAWVVDSVADPGKLAAQDEPLLSWMVAHRSPAATVSAELLSTVGSTGVLAAVVVVVAAVAWWRGVRTEVGMAVVALAGAAALTTVLKNVYARLRPPAVTQLLAETNPSLPSGHSLVSVVALGVVALLLVRIAGDRWRTPAVATAAAGALLIGVSRLYLGVHWLTDVLDGWLVGAAWLTVCLTALRVLPRSYRWMAPQPS